MGVRNPLPDDRRQNSVAHARPENSPANRRTWIAGGGKHRRVLWPVNSERDFARTRVFGGRLGGPVHAQSRWARRSVEKDRRVVLRLAPFHGIRGRDGPSFFWQRARRGLVRMAGHS